MLGFWQKSPHLVRILAATVALLISVSSLAQIAPFPMPRPAERFFYFYTRTDQPAPVTVNGAPSTLPPETLVRLVVSPEPLAAEAITLYFETVPLKPSDKVTRGQISPGHLGASFSTAKAGKDFEVYRQALAAYAEIEKLNRAALTPSRQSIEAKLNLQQVLSDFHNQKCAAGGKAKSKDELILRWESYIQNSFVTKRAQQLAKNAMALDLAARTIIFESQKQNELGPDAHPQAATCQWDLIALSMHNRSFRIAEVFRKSYGAEFKGDIAGVATNSQFNVWQKSFTDANPQIFNCFLFKNYDGGMDADYKGVIAQIPKTLGIVKEDQPIENVDLSDRFQFHAEGAQVLKSYTHYYHPKGMGRCHVGQRVAPRLVSGFLRLGPRGLDSNEGTSLNYKFLSVPIINGKVLGHSDLRIEKSDDRRLIYYGYHSLPVYEWKIKVYQKRKVNGRDTWLLVPAEEVFDAEVGLVDSRDLTEEFEEDVYTCLPQGVFPQCFAGQNLTREAIASSGKRTPLTWFDESIRDDIGRSLELLGFTDARQGLNLPENYRWKNKSGSPVMIRCTSPGMADDSRRGDERFPGFGGRCDTNMMMFTGVDR